MTTALLFALLACGGAAPTAPEGAPSLAEKTGAMAKEIAADPSKRADVLKANGMDEAAFERALYDIAADAELTKAYEAARAK